MKKSFMNNIKHFVDSNVRHRIDKVAHNNNEFFGDDLLLLERHFEEIRSVCIEAEKRISTSLQSIQTTQTFGAYTQNVQAGFNNLSQNISQATVGTTGTISANFSGVNNLVSNGSNISTNASRESKSTKHYLSPVTQSYRFNEFHGNSNDGQSSDLESTQQLTTDIQQRHRKLPVVGFLKFLVKFRHKLRPNSLLATTFTHCSQLQTQLTQLYLSYDQTIDLKCLKPIQQLLEVDIPNVIRLRKLFIKSHNDLEALRIKFNGASQKQQQQLIQAANSSNTSYTISQTSSQQSNLNKLDNLRKDLDDHVSKFEQAKDTYETDLFAFVCRETELVDLLRLFYQLQAEYHQQVANVIQGSLPGLNHTLANTSRKLVFGTHLDEHLRCTGRPISPLIEICTHILYIQGLREEGLFRVPGSSMKIKKLKNAINAWFVTSASNSNVNDLNEHGQAGYASIVGLHDLFKRIAGQTQSDCCQQLATISDETNSGNNGVNFRANLLYFDIHSIAGLLKLYLRELPEPLFTFGLYNQWIDAVKLDSIEGRLSAIRRVLNQLPKTNYENLRHLIKFLHLLTCHQEYNKMSSTNLAITMTPSLMWSNLNGSQVVIDDSTLLTDANQESANSLNVQMSSIGLSASMHALIIETLINNAESLFQNQEVDFSLPGFEHLTLYSVEPTSALGRHHRERSLAKSTSPTGLSTTSSSSLSSTASQSRVSSETPMKTHSRKGGSMDGLINDSVKYESVAFRSGLSNGNSSARPMSVFLHTGDYTASRASQHQPKQQPPPVPPMPRSYFKSTNPNISDVSTSVASSSNQEPSSLKFSSKLPAPPAPSTVSRLSPLQGLRLVPDTIADNPADLKPRATSLRGTGTIQPTTANITSDDQSVSCHQVVAAPPNVVARPSCPPPERPRKLKVSEDDSASEQQQGNVSSATELLKCSINPKSEETDSKSSHSFTSSGNLRADFEEISAGDIEGADDDDDDEVDINGPVSPVVSSNSVSVEDADSISNDSSFNNDDDSQSLDYSWTEFNLSQEHGVVERDLSSRRRLTNKADNRVQANTKPLALPRQQQPQQPLVALGIKSGPDGCGTASNQIVNSDTVAANANNMERQHPSDQQRECRKTPKRLPRSSAPKKITQSTPL